MLRLARGLVTAQLDIHIEANEDGVEHKVYIANNQEEQHAEDVASVLLTTALGDIFRITLPKYDVAVDLPAAIE